MTLESSAFYAGSIRREVSKGIPEQDIPCSSMQKGGKEGVAGRVLGGHRLPLLTWWVQVVRMAVV